MLQNPQMYYNISPSSSKSAHRWRMLIKEAGDSREDEFRTTLFQICSLLPMQVQV